GNWHRSSAGGTGASLGIDDRNLRRIGCESRYRSDAQSGMSTFINRVDTAITNYFEAYLSALHYFTPGRRCVLLWSGFFISTSRPAVPVCAAGRFFNHKLDSHFRGNDRGKQLHWIPACAGMTRKTGMTRKMGMTRKGNENE